MVVIGLAYVVRFWRSDKLNESAWTCSLIESRVSVTSWTVIAVWNDGFIFKAVFCGLIASFHVRNSNGMHGEDRVSVRDDVVSIRAHFRP